MWRNPVKQGVKTVPEMLKDKAAGMCWEAKKNILKGKRQRASGTTENYDNNNNSVDSCVESQLYGCCTYISWKATLHDRRESQQLPFSNDSVIWGGGPEVENPWRRIYIVPQGKKKNMRRTVSATVTQSHFGQERSTRFDFVSVKKKICQRIRSSEHSI